MGKVTFLINESFVEFLYIYIYLVTFSCFVIVVLLNNEVGSLSKMHKLRSQSLEEPVPNHHLIKNGEELAWISHHLNHIWVNGAVNPTDVQGVDLWHFS